MRHESRLKEDAKNLSIIAGSAMVAAALTAVLLVAPLHGSRTRGATVPTEPSSVDAGPARDTGARLILIGHDTRHDSHGKRDVHVVVVRTGDGKRVVTVRSDGGASVAKVENLSESLSTH